MKRFAIVVLLVFTAGMLAVGASAGEVTLTGMFDEPVVSGSAEIGVPLGDDGEKGPGHWGGFGGPMVHYVQLDLSATEPMTEDRGLSGFNDELYLIGGLGGLIYKDFRFGGFGFGNSWEESGRDALGNRLSAEMSFGGGGVFFEYNTTLNRWAGFLAGSYLGAGGFDFEASGPDMDLLGVDDDWSADGSVFMAYPYLGLWLAPTEWMWVQLDAGYLYFQLDTGGSEFENDFDIEMIDDDLMGGFQAGAKLLFGYNPAIK